MMIEFALSYAYIDCENVDEEHLCCLHAADYMNILSNYTLFQTVFVTLLAVVMFVFIKEKLDTLRKHWCHVTLVVIGAGPTGLLSAVTGMRSDRVKKIIIYEQDKRNVMFNKPHQIGLDKQSVKFLMGLGVDFDNIEGCWQDGCFFTRISVFVEYLLSLLQYMDNKKVQINFNTQFSKKTLKEVDSLEGRVIVVVCDGSQGKSASILGLSDEFTYQSCQAYGAVATLERNHTHAIPSPELTVHNLIFDLHAYADDVDEKDQYYSIYPNKRQFFHLKIFGSKQKRYLGLTISRCSSRLVQLLRVTMDRSIMRSIFQVCFNTYKSNEEEFLSDTEALRHLKFSQRLFDIKLAHRVENVVYFKETDMFVLTEGEATRHLNFHTGMDINICIKGIQSLSQFIQRAAFASSTQSITETLNYKYKHSVKVTQDFIQNGLKQYIFTK